MIAMELASHGYMVFLLDHHDGSCRYTESSTKTAIKFNESAPPICYDDMHPRMKQREQEVKDLIDELF